MRQFLIRHRPDSPPARQFRPLPPTHPKMPPNPRKRTQKCEIRGEKVNFGESFVHCGVSRLWTAEINQPQGQPGRAPRSSRYCWMMWEWEWVYSLPRTSARANVAKFVGNGPRNVIFDVKRLIFECKLCTMGNSSLPLKLDHGAAATGPRHHPD